MARIVVLGTLDTKGEEHAFVAEVIRGLGHEVLVIDVGTMGEASGRVDIHSREILPGLSQAGDRGACVAEMAQAVGPFLSRLFSKKPFDGVISLGGGGGTSIGTAAMRALPLGVPKVMVSTLASGQTMHYVGTKDIVMIPSIVDVAGLNRLSKSIFRSAAHAVCAMAEARSSFLQDPEDRPLVVASMFGNSTRCVEQARARLESTGIEVLVFHATGSGGRAMESLIGAGMVAGVLDVTTTEIADEVVGGVLSAGSDRLEAAGAQGIPTVIAPGCLDMVNFGPRPTVPKQFEGRRFYQHNDQVTLMRTDADENRQMARFMASKLNGYVLPPVVALPLGGLSLLSEPGQPFHDPEADAALFETLKEELHPEIRVVESPHPINHPEFAGLCAEALLQGLALL